MELSANQISEFLANPVWLKIRADVLEAIEDGRSKLEEANPLDTVVIAGIQGGIQRLREFLQLPDNYLAEIDGLSKEEE